MTVVNAMELGRALATTASQINQQIEAVKKVADEMSCSIFDLRDAQGNFMMAPLLAAKAQTLHALVLVNQRRN